MKKKLTPQFKPYRGQKRYVVAIRAFRRAYSNELKNHKALLPVQQNPGAYGKPRAQGVTVGAWKSVLGIKPIKIDTGHNRTWFLWDELSDRLEELKWVPDDETIDTDSQIAEEGTEVNEDTLYTAESVISLQLQIQRQMMECILKELGVKFVLDESALLPLEEVAHKSFAPTN